MTEDKFSLSFEPGKVAFSASGYPALIILLSLCVGLAELLTNLIFGIAIWVWHVQLVTVRWKWWIFEVSGDKRGFALFIVLATCFSICVGYRWLRAGKEPA